MKCKNCGSERIAEVSGKTSDLCFFRYKDKETDGYVPQDVGIDLGESYGDYIEIDYCLDCGMLQNNSFPISDSIVEKAMAKT